MDISQYINNDLPATAIAARPTDRPPRHAQGEKFLRGPIPMTWLEAAAALPGKVLPVAVAIWFKAGLTNERTIRLGGKLLRRLSVGRNAARRCLKALESAGLISVQRKRGRCPLITLLDCRSVGKTTESQESQIDQNLETQK